MKKFVVLEVGRVVSKEKDEQEKVFAGLWGQYCPVCHVYQLNSQFDHHVKTNHPEGLRDVEQRCSRCNQVKPVGEFHLRRNRRSGKARQPFCKACDREYQRTRYAEAKNGQVRAYDRQTAGKWRNVRHCEKCGKKLPKAHCDRLGKNWEFCDACLRQRATAAQAVNKHRRPAGNLWLVSSQPRFRPFSPQQQKDGKE